MLALYRSGRQADALGSFQEARATLVDELGIEPGPVLRQLELAILRQDPSLDLAGTRDPERSILVVALAETGSSHCSLSPSRSRGSRRGS